MALEIVQILASGTFGHVAVVRDTASDTLFAAKVLRDEHVENEKVVRRLMDEAGLLQRLSHPNIVGVDGIREIRGRPVLLLEWIRGAPLDALLFRSPEGLPPGDACEIVRLSAGALHAAYTTVDRRTGQAMRVIHRDLKPSNLLLSAEGELKMLDFGIAKSTFVGKQSETVTVVLGAHGYLAPERLDGEEDTPAGDIYALGCILFELLTSRRITLSLHPRAHVERLQRELMRIRPAGTSAIVTHELTSLLQAMCAYEPERRPNHVQVHDALARVIVGAGYAPDLYRLARKHVVPAIEARSFESPARHPAWPDLRFIEESTGETPAGAPPRASDVQIRTFLATADWHLRVDQLRRMLAADPSWTAAPFLEHLQRLQSGPFWRRWGTDRDGRAQLVAVLEFLGARPGDEVASKVRAFMKHRDPEVVALARRIAS